MRGARRRVPHLESEEEIRARRRPKREGPAQEPASPLPAVDLAGQPATVPDRAGIPWGDQARRAEALLGLQQAQGNLAVQRLMAGARNADEEPPLPNQAAVGLDSAQTAGYPLEPAVRAEMEAAFGRDLGDVRTHADAAADALARSVGAEAFTAGQEIFFAQGAYDPGSARGRETLGHELAHVIQQEGGAGQTPGTVTRPGDASEREAEVIGARLGSGGPAPLPPITAMPEAALQTQPQAGTVEAAAPPDLSPAMRVLWEDSVVRRIREAYEALTRRPPRVRLAAERVREAGEVVQGLNRQYAGQPTRQAVRLRLVIFGNLLAYYHLALTARVNEEQVDVPDVRDFLDPEGEEMREWLTRLPEML